MQFIQPKGFITNVTPIFEWQTVDGATSYEFTLLDNVTSDVIIQQVVSGTTYEATTPLAYGTYLAQVQAGDNIANEVIIVTNTIAQYTIIGREGDANYTNYKTYQQAIRQQAKQAAQMALSALTTNDNIALLLAESGDANLAQYHNDTISQTPGLTSEFTQLLDLFRQVVAVTRRINLRDPQF